MSSAVPDKISEDALISGLRRGVERTKSLIAHWTDYHGGPTTTEYLLTSDIAREFIEAYYETRVEFLNRRLVNGLTALKPAPALDPLNSKRTDVVLLYGDLIPVAVSEVKIGVATLNGISGDLDKITDTFRRLNSTSASKVIGAVVFQVHIGTTKTRNTMAELKAEIEKKERRIKTALSVYAKDNDGFAFRMVSLQGPDEGIAASDEDNSGHATRYHVVVIRDKRPAPLAKTLSDLKEQKRC